LHFIKIIIIFGFMSLRKVFNLFHRTDPYKDFNQALYPHDLRGWWSDEPIFENIIDLKKPELIVEIGTWKGASAIHMANICDDHHLDTEIVCVDPFTGGAGTWLYAPDSLILQNGRSTMYELFLANVIRQNHTDRITPFPVTASVAADAFKRAGIKPDIVYIDGSHLERDVANDLTSFEEILNEGGIILCDDYKHSRIPGVTQAVTKFLQAQPGYTIIEAQQVGRATEWIAPGDSTMKCILMKSDNPLLSAVKCAAENIGATLSPPALV
jgi:predicted O-methyltransferase YrrM